MSAKEYVNLLPEEDQKEFAFLRLHGRILNLIIWIVISLLVMTVLFLGTRLYLRSEISQTQSQIELQQQIVSQEENKEIREQVVSLNNDLKNLVTLEDAHARWSEALIRFSKLVPEDVAIDSFVAERGDNKVRISGFAKTRESILELRENLLSSDYFKDVNFPLSNLVSPQDATFRYTFYVDAEMLIGGE